MLSPQGQSLDEKLVCELSNYDQIIMLCGHYEGQEGVDRDAHGGVWDYHPEHDSLYFGQPAGDYDLSWGDHVGVLWPREVVG